MKKLLFTLLPLILFGSFLSAQVYLPYRVGDKFGISDEVGKMSLPAKFDKITIGYDKDFIGYNYEDNAVKTSYILKNKVIIKDSDFNYFTNEKDFIIGVQVLEAGEYAYSNRRADFLTQKLFNINGEDLLNKTFNNIIIVEDKKKPALKEDVLILLYTKTDRYSLVLFNKKQKKIIKTYFENSYEVDTNYEKFPKLFSIIYNDARRKKQLVLEFENGKIKTEKTEIFENNDNNEANYRNSVLMGSYETKVPAMEDLKIPEPESEIQTIQTADSHLYNAKSKEVETLEISTKKNNSEYATLKKENNKIGYFLIRENEYLVLPTFDEIILASGRGALQQGFVVKSNNKYQFLVMSNKRQDFITTAFEMFPLFAERDYGRPGFQLIKLFDKNNNFFCYANQDGKLYYSEKETK